MIHPHPHHPSNQGTSQGQPGCHSKAGTKWGQIRSLKLPEKLSHMPGATLPSRFPPSSLPPSASCLAVYLPSGACASPRFSCPSPSALDLGTGCESFGVLLPALTNDKEGFFFHLVNLKWDVEPLDCKSLADGVCEPEAALPWGLHCLLLLLVRLLGSQRVF